MKACMDYCTTGMQLCAIPPPLMLPQVAYKVFALMAGMCLVMRNGINSPTMLAAKANTGVVMTALISPRRWQVLSVGKVTRVPVSLVGIPPTTIAPALEHFQLEDYGLMMFILVLDTILYSGQRLR